MSGLQGLGSISAKVRWGGRNESVEGKGEAKV